MHLSKERIYYLLNNHISGMSNEAEETELATWMQHAEQDSEFKNFVEEIWKQYDNKKEFDHVDWDAMYRRIMPDPVETIKTPKISWKKQWMAAAVILLILLSSIVLYTFLNQPKETELVSAPETNDVAAPTVNRASITLSDKSTIYLDSLENGSVALQGQVSVIKLSDGTIAYKSLNGEVRNELTYNTLTNPRGSNVINMTFADGSRVWLNAGSSVRYPVAFTGNERSVTVNGEAFFEVMPDKSKPFFVSHGDMKIKVLGTSFNVNAYEDEQDIKVTLLEGSVQTSLEKGEWVILKPGQQAQIGKEIKVKKEVNIEAVIAWKNGLFAFDQSDLKSVMRQIARWYDMEVEYAGEVPDRKFGGAISRMSNVSNVLRVLEESQVKFQVEGRKIRVLN